MPSGKTQQTPRPPIIDPASPRGLAVCSYNIGVGNESSHRSAKAKPHMYAKLREDMASLSRERAACGWWPSCHRCWGGGCRGCRFRAAAGGGRSVAVGVAKLSGNGRV
jgi:hypothetical protein